MHLSITAAKIYAENRRTNGSVFYIQVLPGVILRTAQESYIVTQINSENPLNDYRCFAVKDEDWLGNPKHPKHLDCYSHKNGSVDYALETFNPFSRHWIKALPKQNSLMVFGPLVTSIEVEPMKETHNKIIKSKSFGTKYRLGWFETDRHTNGSGVEMFMKQFVEASKDMVAVEKPMLPEK